MSGWTIVIYGAAAVIALQGLVSLMTAHRAAALRRFFNEEVRRREKATANGKPDSDKPTPTPSAA